MPHGKASVHDPWVSTEADPLGACRMLWTVPPAIGALTKSSRRPASPARRLVIESTFAV
jgi:hypothetical protein